MRNKRKEMTAIRALKNAVISFKNFNNALELSNKALTATACCLDQWRSLNCDWIHVWPTIEYTPEIGLKWKGAPWKRLLVSYEFQDTCWMNVIEQMFYLQKLGVIVELNSTYYARRPWSYIWRAAQRLEYCLLLSLRFVRRWGFIQGTLEGRRYNVLQRLEYINLAFWHGRGWQGLWLKIKGEARW